MYFILLFFSLPLLFWSQSVETAPHLKQAGIEIIAVSPEMAEAWRQTELKIVVMSKNEIEGRERLLIPGIQRKVNVASPTSAPWVDANGWRFIRQPSGQFLSDVPKGRAALAALEAFVYNADVVIKIDPADMNEFGKALTFLRTLPTDELPPVADINVIDNGSATTGEIINLLTRRNLLFRLSSAPSSLFPLNIKIGSREYSEDEAANPSAFAQKIRRQLGDDKRSLRIYGSEVVIARLLSDSNKTRLHLLNYSGRELEGLRIRLRGKLAGKEAMVAGFGREDLQDFMTADGATEFTIPKVGNYAMVELIAAK
jgi:hypothetical protein